MTTSPVSINVFFSPLFYSFILQMPIVSDKDKHNIFFFFFLQLMGQILSSRGVVRILKNWGRSLEIEIFLMFC